MCQCDNMTIKIHLFSCLKHFYLHCFNLLSSPMEKIGLPLYKREQSELSALCGRAAEQSDFRTFLLDTVLCRQPSESKGWCRPSTGHVFGSGSSGSAGVGCVPALSVRARTQHRRKQPFPSFLYCSRGYWLKTIPISLGIFLTKLHLKSFPQIFNPKMFKRN